MTLRHHMIVSVILITFTGNYFPSANLLAAQSGASELKVVQFETAQSEQPIANENKPLANIQDQQSTGDHSEPPDGTIIFPFSQELEDILQKYQTPKPITDYSSFTRHTLSIAHNHNDPDSDNQRDMHSVILRPGYDGNEKNFYQCIGLPLGIIVDMDQNSTNSIVTNAQTGDDGTAEPAPLISSPDSLSSLSNTLMPLRDANISIIWLSNQNKESEDATAIYLQERGLADQRDLLAFKNGDSKQERRQYIASRYCIISILGDDKSDFDELFDYLRDPDQFVGLSNMFENGWFIRQLPDFTP